MDDVAEVVGHVSERVDLPLIVDADTGFGNALNGKSLVSVAEMEGKIKAAVDARRSTDTLIVARTDAVAVEGLESAFERAERYVEAGADVLFVEALRSETDMSAALRQLGSRAPMLANMVEGGKTPLLNAEELQRIGYRIVIFPGGTVRALAHSLEAYLQSLRAHGSTAPFLDRMLDFRSLNQLIGTPQMLELGRRYDG